MTREGSQSISGRKEVSIDNKNNDALTPTMKREGERRRGGQSKPMVERTSHVFDDDGFVSLKK